MNQPFEPRHPALVALAFHTVWVALLSVPMLSGKFLATQWSDQYTAGYAFRKWAADQWRATGSIPLWNSDLMGGLPFVAAMHGDTFYPTAWVRLLLPTITAMNVGFAVHYVLAGLFTYLFLRLLRVSWTGAVVGSAAYQLTGVVASLVNPGHDGKLFVSTLLPLALIGLVLAFKRNRPEGYGVLALSVGLSLLGHFQMLYYMLLAAGIFALYLAFGDAERPVPKAALVKLAGALGAVALGFGIASIQLLPFFDYIPFSPRADSYYGYQGATSYAIPWGHVPEFFLAHFAGEVRTYWGANSIKLHSEYLGLPVVALAVWGALDRERRRLVWWLGGIGVLFLLVSLGGSTPFYRLWWAVMPYIKKVRAAGMAFFLPSFVVAVFAALGAARLERGEGQRWPLWALAVGAVVAALAAVGAVGGLAQSMAQAVELRVGTPATQIAAGAAPSIRLGALLSGVALAGVGALVWAVQRGRVPIAAFALGLPLLVGADLWRNARTFWNYSDAADELYRTDAITDHLATVARPYRLLDVPSVEVYPGSVLMAFHVPQLLGHHAFELHNFDELLGGRNEWRYVVSPRIWDLFAIRYVSLPAGAGLADQIPGFTSTFTPVLSNVRTSSGQTADLWARTDSVAYARLVGGAVKAPDEQAIPTIVDPRSRFDPDRIVLLAPDAPVDPGAFRGIPEPLGVRAVFEHWAPGRMRIRLEPAAPQAAYLVVSENWYPGWRAAVDGDPAPVVRGNVSLITVPVPAGAQVVELEFDSVPYRRGRLVSVISVILVVAMVVVPGMVSRRGRGG